MRCATRAPDGPNHLGFNHAGANGRVRGGGDHRGHGRPRIRGGVPALHPDCPEPVHGRHNVHVRGRVLSARCGADQRDAMSVEQAGLHHLFGANR